MRRGGPHVVSSRNGVPKITSPTTLYRSPRELSLIEAYQRVFEGVPADTPELLHAAHRLRHQVFCVENDVFDPANNSGGLERDEYDSHSLQAVLLHRATKMIVGTVRLVLHKPGAYQGSLPFHKICRDPRLRDPGFLPLETTAEVGRFAISKGSRYTLRGVVNGQLCGFGNPADDPRRLIQYLVLGLIMAALQICVRQRIKDICAVMEPTLLRLLARLGFHFEPLGPVVEYYGLRQPCWANIAQLFARVGVERPEIWEVTTNRGRLLKPGFVPARNTYSEAARYALPKGQQAA